MIRIVDQHETTKGVAAQEDIPCSSLVLPSSFKVPSSFSLEVLTPSASFLISGRGAIVPPATTVAVVVTTVLGKADVDIGDDDCGGWVSGDFSVGRDGGGEREEGEVCGVESELLTNMTLAKTPLPSVAPDDPVPWKAEPQVSNGYPTHGLSHW